MDNNKLGFFYSKYKTLDSEELAELALRKDTLSEEANAALVKVYEEQSLVMPTGQQRPISEVSSEEIELDRQRSIELWNGPLSKSIQFRFLLLGLFLTICTLNKSFSGAIFALVIGIIFIPLCQKIGTKITHSICSSSEKSISEKESSLEKVKLMTWFLYIPVGFIGVLLNLVLRK